MLSKVLSYIFALIVIFITGNIIISIVSFQESIPVADWFLIFCLLIIMLMGLFYIANDIGLWKRNKEQGKYGTDTSLLDEELVK